ncbi:hypothetical protein pEaSNUABM37_00070 [Erwinia phage pEa_SNUABM_37]|nr:hypothetical protein pEaSNUABM37_00070 [Erwinia phage pEa_SNUABM_37]QXO10540.1 hypothetical protein pEaSNUABM48_00070 [Erwinia phage pEa_SNUABM_48]
MSNKDIITVVLVVGLVAAIAYALYRGYKSSKTTPGDQQVQVVHSFFNESLHDLLASVSRKIEDHFETEYGDGDYLFEEQYIRHTAIVTDFSGWASNHFGYCGYPHHITSVNLAEAGQFMMARLIRVSTGPAEHKEYIVPFDNLAYLVDRLTDMNTYNEQLVRMFKDTE